MLPPEPTGSPSLTTSSAASAPPPQPPVVHPAPGSRRRRRWAWALSVLAFVLVASGIAVAVVQIPYYSFSPGSLRPTSDLVRIDGPRIYDPDGDVLLTTVSISSRRLTIFEAFLGWLDPTVTVVPEEEVLGPQGHDREATRQFNLQLMDTSKEVATYVALDRLGYEVSLTGTGAQVIEVVPGSAADGVVEPGDTIVAVDGSPVALASDLGSAIDEMSPGDEIVLTVEPLGEEGTEERPVELGAREDDPDAALLGVTMQTRDGAFVFPFDVEFATGQVGGPSAGLSFTLVLLDMLTPGELTGGEVIAATGTIDADGVVGPIGGIEQKAAAARRDGIDLFLVPAATAPNELEAARRQAGDEVEIVLVEDLDDALEVLEARGGDPLPEPTVEAAEAA
ncbi:YlbL family protein [Actinomarinicola tropica]|uniref:PDZ domain-containing protein n=1 Tax=Actinomarinicola tropica TaxID=2789776 RepID=A0A5Q2REF2_9ACTN|nr:S16 family serine protease [Actinomarinicola tropica]QGG93984.1 PDZ domain-containing protein [Actinomarinicola tropica]